MVSLILPHLSLSFCRQWLDGGSNAAVSQVHPSPQKDFSAYNNHQPKLTHLPNEHRTRSETRLIDDYQPGLHFNTRYGSRLVNGGGAPLSTNPIWSGQSSSTAGSQPNLLLHEMPVRTTYFPRQISPSNDRRMISAPVQHPLYASHPHEKSPTDKLQSAAQQAKRNRKQTAQSQYLDTNEFILRASNGQLLRPTPYPDRYASGAMKDHRPHSMNIIGSHGTMLDVYY